MKREGQEQSRNVEDRRHPGGGAPAAATLNAAAPIGADTSRYRCRGLVVPGSFTRRGAEQRTSGFRRGRDGRRLETSNCFGAR
jgi:predicted metalloprotease